MFLFVDWITLVQHIETYLQIGVTKFFIYVQTISPEVDLILKIYREAGVVELLPWPPFPYSESQDSLNANNVVYRADLVTAINDCILRVRPLSDFALFTDVDEIISSLSNNVSLINLFENGFTSSKSSASTVGSLMFRSATVRVPPIKDKEQMDVLSISFDSLSRIEHEGKIWQAGAMSKILLRTDAVRIMHIHAVGQFERNRKWTNKVVNETDGLMQLLAVFLIFAVIVAEAAHVGKGKEKPQKSEQHGENQNKKCEGKGDHHHDHKHGANKTDSAPHSKADKINPE
uniref:Glycosyltransferase family 92 protein n=1 Tax=Plectus sambesii TaxID=2011161 RepID=A0A914VQ05_9BILA